METDQDQCQGSVMSLLVATVRSAAAAPQQRPRPVPAMRAPTVKRFRACRTILPVRSIVLFYCWMGRGDRLNCVNRIR